MQVVSEYVYLGQVVTPDPNHEAEVIRRIRLGWSAFGRHCKMRAYDSCILPALTYGAVTWRLTER